MHARLYISKSLFKHDYSNYQLLKASIPKKMQIEIFSVKNVSGMFFNLKIVFFCQDVEKKEKIAREQGTMSHMLQVVLVSYTQSINV